MTGKRSTIFDGLTCSLYSETEYHHFIHFSVAVDNKIAAKYLPFKAEVLLNTTVSLLEIRA